MACSGSRTSHAELERCELARFDPDAWTLYHDFEILRALEASDEARAELGRASCAPS